MQKSEDIVTPHKHMLRSGQPMSKKQPSERRWQDDRDDELDAPDQYPDPEPDYPYTPNQA